MSERCIDDVCLGYCIYQFKRLDARESTQLSDFPIIRSRVQFAQVCEHFSWKIKLLQHCATRAVLCWNETMGVLLPEGLCKGHLTYHLGLHQEVAGSAEDQVCQCEARTLAAFDPETEERC